MKYLEPYAALTDEALAGLASAGLLRRARKLADDVTEEASGAKGANLSIGGHAVRVDGRGPAAVACACPTGGVCVHVVVACRWARDRASELGVEAPAGPAPGDRAEGPGRSADAGPARRAGAADGDGRGRASGRGHAGAARAAAKRSAVAERRAVALAEVRDVVVHLLDGGLAHLRDDASESLRALAGRVRVAGFDPVHGLRLDALLRTAAGQAADLAAHDDGTDEAGLLSTLTEVWALCEAHEHAGDRPVGEPEPRRAAEEPGTGRSGGPAGAPAAAGGPAAASEAAARTRKSAGSRTGRDEDDVDLGRLVPLAVRWWTGASGSRGVVLAAWDPSDGRVRTAVTGRPAGGDPSFRREWDTPLLWGASAARLSAGPFAVSAVRARPDGSLGAGGRPRLASLGDFDLDELRGIADRTGAATPARDTVGFGRRPSHVRLLLVRDSGEVGIDEVRQEVTWNITDSSGQEHLLRVPVEDRRTADTLLHVLAGRWSVVGVTAERRAERLEPAGIFVRGTDGAIRLISPSIMEQYQLGRESRWSHHHWETWRKRLSRVAGMRSRARAVIDAAEPEPPVVRACGLAWDVLVAVAATGRGRLTPRQRSDVGLARALARDLGLSTLERAVSDLVPDDGAPVLTPETVARTAFLVRRTQEVASTT
ncbi:hypothetical protein GCM10028784_27690 [Myceligenerans cantabricum]